MGWGRYFLLGDWGQQMDLADQKVELESLRDELRRSRGASSDSNRGDSERLQAENDELRLYLAAVVRLLISKGLVSQEEIRQVVDVVDIEDGTLDGRYEGRLQ